MHKLDLVVNNPNGLHMRVASRIAKLAEDHQATIQLTNEDNRQASGASILEMLTLGVQQGTRLIVSVEGPSAAIVASKLTGLFAEGGGI